MPQQSRTDKLQAHMKRLRKQRAKDYMARAKKGNPTLKRNLVSELMTASFDLEQNQFPIYKMKILKEKIKLRLEETKGRITPEIKIVQKKIKRFENGKTNAKRI